jgi:hypothetical protein
MFSKKEKIVEFTLKNKIKIKNSPISLLKNDEISRKNLCSASLCVSGISGNLSEVGILQNADIENEVYIVSYKGVLGLFICS